MIQVIHIPAFSDNYIWLISNEERRFAVLVDPGDAEPVIAELERRQMQAVAVLITHHHADHIGGLKRLLERYPDLAVYGPEHDLIVPRTHTVRDGDPIEIDALGLSFTVMQLPGHTASHVAYWGEGSLFCGDTLFGSGCGRVFDGTLEDLHASLQRLAQLPADTLIYCAHEYTLDNIGFAKWVEPDNAELDERQDACWELLDAGRTTVPFMLGGEFRTNPFLRTHIPEVIAKAEEVAGRELKTPAEVFAALRIWKDTEYD